VTGVDVAFQFRHRDPEVFGDVLAGDVDERHARVEQDPRRVAVLAEVELRGRGPVPGMTPEPHDDDLVDDVGGHQQRGGDVRRRADRDHVERSVPVVRRRPLDDIGGGRTLDGGVGAVEILSRSPVDEPSEERSGWR